MLSLCYQRADKKIMKDVSPNEINDKPKRISEIALLSSTLLFILQPNADRRTGSL
jgi:hypothetical protein